MSDSTNYGKTIMRLLAYFRYFKFRSCLVLLFVLISAAVSVVSATFLKLLIDDFIVPLLGDQNPVFDALLQALTILAVVYAAGVISTFASKRLMITISQQILKKFATICSAKCKSFPLSILTEKHMAIL